jgi:hypothetical protein
VEFDRKTKAFINIDNVEFWARVADKAGEIDKACEPMGGFERVNMMGLTDDDTTPSSSTSVEKQSVDKTSLMMLAQAEALETLRPVQLMLANQVNAYQHKHITSGK